MDVVCRLAVEMRSAGDELDAMPWAGCARGAWQNDRERCIRDHDLPVLVAMCRKLFPTEKSAFDQRPKKEPMAHDREVLQRRRFRESIDPMSLDLLPGPVDAIVEDLPGLTLRWRISGHEGIEIEIGVGRPAERTEVALLEVRDFAKRRARGSLDRLCGHSSTRKMARPDFPDRRGRESLAEPIGLFEAAIGKRGLSDLNDAISVAEGFAVSNEKNGHGWRGA